jgi:long-chain acyl-CoA synthetase
MALQQVVADKWKKITQRAICEGYGLTETSPVVSANPLNATEFSGSIGLPLPSTEIQIRDDNGHEVMLGESGELCVRGPQVMLGYWQRDDETAKVIDKDGWLATGDVAKVDENGFIYIGVSKIKF